MTEYNRLAPVEQNHPTLTDSSGIVIAYVARLERERDALRGALIDTTVSLAAAISLLEHGSKKAAPSDKMFDQMLRDYRKSLDHARAALEAKP